jgi:hypothetical protein
VTDNISRLYDDVRHTASHALGDPREIAEPYDDLMDKGRSFSVRMPVMASFFAKRESPSDVAITPTVCLFAALYRTRDLRRHIRFSCSERRRRAQISDGRSSSGLIAACTKFIYANNIAAISFSGWNSQLEGADLTGKVCAKVLHALVDAATANR